VPVFSELAAAPAPPLDRLALALAAEFRSVDMEVALARLDALGAELTALAGPTPAEQARACAELLGGTHAFAGDRTRYDDPENSMLDRVLERRQGLPILLSVVYVEVARRAGIALAGVGLPGHFVAGHFGVTPPLLLDAFDGGTLVEPVVGVRPWGPHEIALRMLNNLVGSFERRGNLAGALHAAELRLAVPTTIATHDALELELQRMRARLN
jgi:hypothetical protein